ncbi:MAG TPA: contractile injection system tape measure protein [Crinalium sp.]|jgi:hypothetical protein
MSQQRHVIGRTILEIDSDRLDEMWSFQHDISDLFQQQAIPAMEQLFDQLVGADEVIRLDQVVVQLNPIDRQFLADEFVRHLLDALYLTLSDRLTDPVSIVAHSQSIRENRSEPHPEALGTSAALVNSDRTAHNTDQLDAAELVRRDRTEADWEVLLYFLQYGRLPWWCLMQDWQTWISRWERVMQEGHHWQTPLRELLAASLSARQRLVAQFSDGFRHQVVLQLQPTWFQWSTLLVQARQLIQALQLSDRTAQHLQTQAWLLLLSELGQAGSSNRPFPALAWLCAWLTHVIMTVEDLPESMLVIRSEEWGDSTQVLLPRTSFTEPGIGVSGETGAELKDQTGRAIAHSHWHNLIESLELTDKALWLTALNQVMPHPSITISEGTAPQPSSLNEPEDHREQMNSASESDDIPASLDVNETAIASDTERVRALAEQAQSINSTQISKTSSRTNDSSLSPEDQTAGLFVNQAGLVILHPFLLLYFEDAGLLEGEEFRDRTAQQTAIYLLHYLATKQTDAPEYELVLPKLLCGWPLNEPVSRELTLPDTALTEAEHLLQTVIDYWQVLKSTSPDGLREGFLQRPGKLTQLFEGDWRLQVEQQAIDVLLGSLPWGFNVVKLPWMESMLMVEWS